MVYDLVVNSKRSSMHYRKSMIISLDSPMLRIVSVSFDDGILGALGRNRAHTKLLQMFYCRERLRSEHMASRRTLMGTGVLLVIDPSKGHLHVACPVWDAISSV